MLKDAITGCSGSTYSGERRALIYLNQSADLNNSILITICIINHNLVMKKGTFHLENHTAQIAGNSGSPLFTDIETSKVASY